MRILALDLGTHTGWAACDDDGAGVESGTQTFDLKRGESPGMRFIRFRAWIAEMLDLWAPDLVAYEVPHHRGGPATELLVGLSTRVLELAAEIGLDVVGVHTGTLKKHATGSGRASKADMVLAAQERWGCQTPPGEDEADALCVLSWALEEVGR